MAFKAKHVFVILGIILFTVGCNKAETGDKNMLYVTEKVASGWGAAGETIKEYNNLSEGDVLYDDLAFISVKSVKKDRIILNTECLIEPNEDGTVNLLAKGPKTVHLSIGDSVTLCTQTMDAGATITIEYK